MGGYDPPTGGPGSFHFNLKLAQFVSGMLHNSIEKLHHSHEYESYQFILFTPPSAFAFYSLPSAKCVNVVIFFKIYITQTCSYYPNLAQMNH